MLETVELHQRLRKCLMEWWREQIGLQADNRIGFLPNDSYRIKSSLNAITEQMEVLASLVRQPHDKP